MINLYVDRVKELVSKFTIEEKVNLMCQYQEDIPRLNVKKYKHGTEASHGVSWLGKATMFPQPIGLACLWDKKLMEEIGDVIGTEARGFYYRNPDINGLTLWAPTIDLNRDPRWGRTDEGYGEDPVLVGNLAASLIRGIQGNDPNVLKAVPTLKHFYGNNNEINRGVSSTDISERIKREYYLKVFKIAIDNSQVMSMMTAYNSINGIPANIHPDLENIIRKEWKWPGFVVSDAGDVLSLINEHNYVETPEEAVAISIKAGIDSITDDHDICKKAIKTSLKNKTLTEEDLDIALNRAFLVRFMLGEFNSKEDNPYAHITDSVIGDKKHSEVALKAAEKSIVLLKNENSTLPITDKNSSIGLIGNLSDRIYRDWYSGEFLYQVTPSEGIKKYFPNTKVIDGNNRVTIQNNKSGLYLNSNGSFSVNKTIFEMEDWGWGAVTFKAEDNNKYLTAEEDSISASADSIWGWFTKEVFYTKVGDSVEIKTWNTAPAKVKNSKLVFSTEGDSDGEIGITASTPLGPVNIDSGDFSIKIISNGMESAVKLAREVETPIVIIGNHPLINGKETIDRHDLTLAERQVELATKIIKEKPNAVLIVVGSYPFALENLNQLYKTIIYTSHLGQETGNALKNIITGKENPSGRLPITWYKSQKDLGDIMNYELPTAKKTYLYFKGEVDYPFGHGLSYSNFEYKDIKVNSVNINQNDSINLSFTITNNGPYDGDEVIQIYINHNGTKVIRPIKQLVDFNRVMIKNGESKTFNFTIKPEEFNYWNKEENMFLWEKGSGSVIIGSSSKVEIKKIDINLI